MGNYNSLYEYHRTKILLPVEQRLSKLHKELRLASIFKKAFEDPLFLKMQTEYSLNFAKGWQRFLECLKAISELGTFLKVNQIKYSIILVVAFALIPRM